MKIYLVTLMSGMKLETQMTKKMFESFEKDYKEYGTYSCTLLKCFECFGIEMCGRKGFDMRNVASIKMTLKDDNKLKIKSLREALTEIRDHHDHENASGWTHQRANRALLDTTIKVWEEKS